MRRTLTGRKASAFVEFALGLAVVSPVVAGAAQYGWSLYLLHELEAAVERGAEAGCAAPAEDPVTGDPSVEGMEAAIRKAAVERGAGAGLRPEQIQIKIGSGEFEVSVAGYTLPVPLEPVYLNGKPSARFPICKK